MDNVKYHIFGSLHSPKQIMEANLSQIPSLEGEKLDIAPGGEDIKDITPLEDEKDAEKRQGKLIGLGLKIMIPKQMITRLPIFLAHKKAGNNSQKLKN